MTQPDFDAARYVENAGRLCPDCTLDRIWREHRASRPYIVNNVRLVFVTCHCTRCKATWVETYRLVGVHRDRREAIAAANHTYKGDASDA